MAPSGRAPIGDLDHGDEKEDEAEPSPYEHAAKPSAIKSMEEAEQEVQAEEVLYW